MSKLQIRSGAGGGQGDTVTLPLAVGDVLLDLLLQHNVEIGHDCGGKLACASCLVVVREGLESLTATTEDERDMLDLARATEPGSRLACQTVAGSGDVFIEIGQIRPPVPESSISKDVPTLALTERAAAHFKVRLAKRCNAVALRLGVRASGCSGYRYCVDYADAINADDVVFVSQGIRIAIDKASLPLLQGTALDIIGDGLQRRLRFDNPNAKESCGCGESFAT